MTHPATIRKPGEGRRIGIVGDVYRFLATGDETDGKYATFEAIAPPPSQADIEKLLEAASRYELKCRMSDQNAPQHQSSDASGHVADAADVNLILFVSKMDGDH